MRRINKLTPLPSFDGNHYKKCRTWQCFHEKYKDVFEETRLQILIDEQKIQCGYTELYINDESDSHIDHYQKRDYYPNLTFDWNNYIVATKDYRFGANYKDNVYKIRKSEYKDIFNPIIDNIEEYFYYNELGMIREDEGKVQKTIKVFNLNHVYLVERRVKIIEAINAYKNGGLSLDKIKSELETSGFKSVVNQYCKEDN